MKPDSRTLRALAGLAVALSLCAAPAFAKPGDKNKESDDKNGVVSDPRSEQLQQQIKALQKQLDAMQKSAVKDPPKGKAEKRDKDEPKKGEAKAKPEYKKADTTAGPRGKDKASPAQTDKPHKIGRAMSAADVMVPVDQLPHGIAKRFAGQKMVSSSLLPPGIARKFTGAGDNKDKEKGQAAGGAKADDYKKIDGKQKPGKRGGDDDDEDEKPAKGKGKK